MTGALMAIVAATPAAPSYDTNTLVGIIGDLGLTSGLKLCLDAADANSYSGSGQTWLDLSGGGYDFYRGTTSGSEASDPTFNGTAGNKSSSEYWSNDGGDEFRYDAAVETWMSELHKNSAKVTVIAVFSLPVALSGMQVRLFNTLGAGGSEPGVILEIAGQDVDYGTEKEPNVIFTDGLTWYVYDDAGNAAAVKAIAGGTPGSGSIYDNDATQNFVAVSYDEAAATSLQTIYNNIVTYVDEDPTVTGPGTDPAQVPRLFEDIGAATTGFKLHALAVWDTNLSAANLKAIQAALKTARSYAWTNAA